MMTFISCAKTMTGRSKMQTPVTSTPQFQTEAIQNALDMSQFSAEELERLLRVNSKIAAENYMRFQDFCSDSPSALAALLAYTTADLPFASMHRLTLTADLGYRLSPDDVQALNVSAGAEYAWMEHLMLRGGYHYGDKNKGDASYATAGAGVEYAGVHLDFAWMFAGHECLARNTFWISLGYSF